MSDELVYILVSKQDEASLLMKEKLLASGLFEASEVEFESERLFVYKEEPKIKIATIPEKHIYSKLPNQLPDASLFIYASKHSSVAGQKTLLTHTTGLWTDDTTHGGPARSLALAPAAELFTSYHSIKRRWIEAGLEEYKIGFEVTHHGPTDIKAPLLFVEQGGTLEEWTDPRAAEVTSKVILDVALFHVRKPEFNVPIGIGIGGNHYCARFLKVVDQGRYALGHIAPKHVLDEVSEEQLVNAVERTIGEVSVILVDKKGTRSNHKEMARKVGKELNLEVVMV